MLRQAKGSGILRYLHLMRQAAVQTFIHDKNQSCNLIFLIRTVFLRRFSRVSAIFPLFDKNPLFAFLGITRCDLTEV